MNIFISKVFNLFKYVDITYFKFSFIYEQARTVKSTFLPHPCNYFVELHFRQIAHKVMFKCIAGHLRLSCRNRFINDWGLVHHLT